jgi:hypothetical protein
MIDELTQVLLRGRRRETKLLCLANFKPKNCAGFVVDKIISAGFIVGARLEKEFDAVVKTKLSLAHEFPNQIRPGVETRLHARIIEDSLCDYLRGAAARAVGLAFGVNMANPGLIIISRSTLIISISGAVDVPENGIRRSFCEQMCCG